MNIQWDDLMAGVALAMIIEGLTPFISPKGFKRALFAAIQMSDNTIRALALLSISFGLLVLYLARH